MKNMRSELMGVAIASFGVIAVALYLQHAKGMLPCPLCIIQRYCFLWIGLFAVAGLLSPWIKTAAATALAGAIAGVGVASKHLWVLAHPGTSCGIDPVETFLNKIITAEWVPMLFKADGLCEDALAPLLGLSIPQWSFLTFALIAIGLIKIIVSERK